MTELLYLSSIQAAYERNFRAQIIALPPGGVALDRTLFYPTGGGQPADQGTITGPHGTSFPVVDVTKAGSTVVHRVGRGPPGSRTLALGDSVEGAIDWSRRYRHMRLHTAQHLLSATVFAQTGLRTSRASFAGTGGSIQLEGVWPEGRSNEPIERELSSILASPTVVSIRSVSHADWEAHPSPRSGLVRIPPHVDPVRLVEIGEWDLCPCGGTHVRSTHEIGGVSLDRPIPLSGGACRLSFTIREVLPPSSTG